jgi:hypothetical protein
MNEAKNSIGPDHYRYVDTIGPDGLEVHCLTYTVIGETPACWYIADEYTARLHQGIQQSWTEAQVKRNRKRVLKEGGEHSKRFAYTTKDLALRSFKIRKVSQIAHAEMSLERARAAIGYFGDLSVNSSAHDADLLIIPNEYIQQQPWGDC